MHITMDGHAEKDFAPDQINAVVNFEVIADNYDDALKKGVKAVSEYIDYIIANTDFKKEEFKTSSYNVYERYHYNEIKPTAEEDLDKNLRKRISDGYTFSQTGVLTFDYDKKRLAELLVFTSKNPNAPRFHVNFGLKDVNAKKRELIGAAYEDARAKAEALASAAGKHLRDCIHVDIDGPHRPGSYGMEEERCFGAAKMMRAGAARAEIDNEIKAIDDSFRPEDITLNKSISCVWETSD